MTGTYTNVSSMKTGTVGNVGGLMPKRRLIGLKKIHAR
jgi:hypothetical protein